MPAAQVGTAYRPFPAGLSAQEVFCFKYGRTVALDNTVQLGEHRLQLLPDKERRSYARAHVEVHERLDGSLAVYYAGRCLTSTPAPLEAPCCGHGRGVCARLVPPRHRRSRSPLLVARRALRRLPFPRPSNSPENPAQVIRGTHQRFSQK